MDLVQHGGGTICPNQVHKIDCAAVDEALDGEAKSGDGTVVVVHHHVGEGEQHEEVEEPPHAEPWPTVRRCQRLLHAEPNQHDGRERYDDVNPHRGNRGGRRGCKRSGTPERYSQKDLYPCSMPSCLLLLASRQYACVRRFAAPLLVVVMLAL